MYLSVKHTPNNQLPLLVKLISGPKILRAPSPNNAGEISSVLERVENLAKVHCSFVHQTTDTATNYYDTKLTSSWHYITELMTYSHNITYFYEFSLLKQHANWWSPRC